MVVKSAKPILPKRDGTQPLQIKRRSISPPIARIDQDELAEIAKEIQVIPEIKKTLTPKSPMSRSIATSDVPFRVVKPSLPTLEKAMSVALFFEQYYHALLRPPVKAQPNAIHPGNTS